MYFARSRAVPNQERPPDRAIDYDLVALKRRGFDLGFAVFQPMVDCLRYSRRFPLVHITTIHNLDQQLVAEGFGILLSIEGSAAALIQDWVFVLTIPLGIFRHGSIAQLATAGSACN
ncbi:hypothetical protein FHW02_001574 [Ochrobactrum sp. RH1CCR137]|nr:MULTISPECIES: hypothetical protein [unclassified Ochrobactrum]MBA8843538.1 hypothetical protein [Ochrobactrum sp. RH1CCR137]MBA8855726.1 hypothetical protein [Ochrobactrum sp. RH1CCR134]